MSCLGRGLVLLSLGKPRTNQRGWQGGKGDAEVLKPLGRIFFGRSTDPLEGCAASPQRRWGWAMLPLRVVSEEYVGKEGNSEEFPGKGGWCWGRLRAGGCWGTLGSSAALRAAKGRVFGERSPGAACG